MRNGTFAPQYLLAFCISSRSFLDEATTCIDAYLSLRRLNVARSNGSTQRSRLTLGITRNWKLARMKGMPPLQSGFEIRAECHWEQVERLPLVPVGVAQAKSEMMPWSLKSLDLRFAESLQKSPVLRVPPYGIEAGALCLEVAESLARSLVGALAVMS